MTERRAGLRPGLLLLIGLAAPLPVLAEAVAGEEAEATPSFLAPQRFLVTSGKGGAGPSPSPSPGLFLVEMARDGAMQTHPLAAPIDPNWIAPSPDGRFVYLSDKNNAGGDGRLLALRWQNDAATVLNRVPSGGGRPLSGTVSPDGRSLLVVTASSQTGPVAVAVFALEPDGRIGRLRQRVSLPQGDRAAAPDQAGSVVVSPDARVVYVVDPTGDAIRAFRFQPDDPSPLQAWADADLHLPPGNSPGRLVFAPDGRHAYLASSAALHVFSCENDRLRVVQVLPFTKDAATVPQRGGGLAISPDGRFLFVDGPGSADGILSVRLGEDGRAAQVGRFPSGGTEPGTLAVDMIGERLLVAVKAANRIAELLINRYTGALSPVGVPPLRMAGPTAVESLR